MNGGAVIGWDMTAALALGRALGIDELLMAEMLPDIEDAMAEAINDRSSEDT